MCYYAVVDSQDNICAIWKLHPDSAQQLSGTLGPQQITYQTLFPNPPETPLAAMKRTACSLLGSGVTFVKTKLAPGEYYPRIARPSDISEKGALTYPGIEHLKSEIAIAGGQLAALTSQLERICRTIHPADTNLDGYGHDIRNLLILACTEVEAHWRGVLQASKARPINTRDFTTNDYVKLCEPMRLNEYAVAFPYYPWMLPVGPFGKWSVSGSPTKDLSWYDAYNAVKHNREQEFPKATLMQAFQATSACAIMILAQYGNERMLRSFFTIQERPQWPLDEIYVHPYTGNGLGPWTQKPYAF